MFRKSIALWTVIALLVLCFVPAAPALEPTTLCHGMQGEEVRELQQALIDLGYLKGTADGIFGNKTEIAVRKFQKKNKLSADGLAGTKTRQLIMGKAAGKASSAAGTAQANASAASSSSSSSSSSASSASSQGFSGNYSSLRIGSSGSRVVTLQKALISLNYLSGSADGQFGKKTLSAVMEFQRVNKLSADGVAGKKTLTALEKAVANGQKKPEGAAESEPAAQSETAASKEETASDGGSISPKISGPSSGSVQLLSWYDQVKPALSNRQQLLIYDPSSGLSWTLSIISRGRHCDAEPLTAQDTRTMVKAFGGTNTWNQKAVYVRLPDGRWTVGSTHDMPHDSGSISGNNFNGHLCVHFLRTMEECTKNDPNYGVSNQKTIRAFWKKLTGEEITD